ncbi:CaiB/BaiF CoA transferase family protein [Oryzicola mucosus]|uniref:CoA transferase n=1 Tax=Oryzicola mucosus TaxID=2767425 RepID=A0A8J6PXT7_9HYPH|nr:CoA transferase [Oryzicola mucosus]MBD0417361.1 CoA transferase [Oryzicola mucosus]
MTNIKPLPLEGVRVLDIASLYAAPFAATLLGDFGAEVIKVEPPEGDGFRGTGMWGLVGRNKKSVTLDLRSPDGCENLLRLVETADVVVQNFPREVLERRGLGWDAMSARNPRLIMVSVSCFGQDGPYAGRPGSGTIGEGFGGLTALTGRPNDVPMLSSVALGDAIGAMSAAMGTMAALYWRDVRGGTGQEIDVSLYEPILMAISGACAQWSPGNSPGRLGGRLGSGIRNSYRTGDGEHVVISASTQRHAADMAALVGAEPDTDPDAAVARWIARHTLAEVLDILTARRLPVATVNHIDDLLSDPQVIARGSLIRTEVEGRPAVIPSPQPKLSKSPGTIRTLGAALGAHNAEVLGGLEQAIARAAS